MVRLNQKFSKRTFLLPHELIDQDPNDNVLTTVQHLCPDSICKKMLDSKMIIQNARASYYSSGGRNNPFMTRRRFHWECYNCAAEIHPRIRVRIGNRKEKVPLYHVVKLRGMVEKFLKVDENYEKVK